jgi:hypothetical protein
VIAVTLVLVVVLSAIGRKRTARIGRKRTERLKKHFGPEYERAVGEAAINEPPKRNSLRANVSDRNSTSSRYRRKPTLSMPNTGGQCRLRSSIVPRGRWATLIAS